MKRKVWALLTALAVCVSSTNLRVLAEGNDVNLEVAAQQAEYVLPFCEKKDDVMLDFKLVNEWEGGYQSEIVVTNMGEETLEKWQLDFQTRDIVTNIWNCNVLQNEAGTCSVSALEYNSVLEPNGSISIGYCAEGDSCSVNDLRITVITDEPDTSDTTESGEVEMGPYFYAYEGFAVEYIIQNNWSEKCNVCLKITNTSETDIENWKLVWESEDVLSNVYNAEMTSKDNVYTLKMWRKVVK